jgi:hypothetical protein
VIEDMNAVVHLSSGEVTAFLLFGVRARRDVVRLRR